MWLNNRKVLYTFASVNSMNAWAYISNLSGGTSGDNAGWYKIKPLATDGVTNLFMMMNEAKGSDRLVNVYIDANQISTAYLL